MSADFWSSIATAHRVDDGQDARGVLDPDPLESDPESDEDDCVDGVFAPQFVASTGIHEYLRSCRSLGVIPVQQFVSMLERDVVSLKHRGVGAVGGRAIFECLRHNKHIQSLDMEDNQLGLNVDADDGGFEPICAAIRGNDVLTHLDLSYNNLASRGCAVIAKAFEENTSIGELSLRGNNVGDVGARALSEAIGKRSALSKLDLSDNGISESGGAALAALIGGVGPLKQADFSWNALRLSGAVAVAEGLRTSSLVRLNLAWNGIGEKGAEAVGAVLKENAALQFLDISSNRISEQGAAAVADGLRENQTLRSLQLNGNPIGDQGVMLVMEAVGTNCSVRDLGLQDCLTTKGGAGLFDPLNPTGAYKLNMAAEFERSIFSRLKELDSLESEVSGGTNFLNVCYNQKPVCFEENGMSIQTWPDGKGTVPETGSLFFDYVAAKEVPREARPLREEVFQSFLREMANPALSESTKLLMLRTAATTHFYTAGQVRILVKMIEYQGRVDAVVMLFRRVVDPENFYDKVFCLLKASESSALRARLGKALTPMLPVSEVKPDPEPKSGGGSDEMASFFLTEEDPEDTLGSATQPDTA